ncbi:hypothetical protein [Streptomyces sp. NPDC002537]
MDVVGGEVADSDGTVSHAQKRVLVVGETVIAQGAGGELRAHQDRGATLAVA